MTGSAIRQPTLCPTPIRRRGMQRVAAKGFTLVEICLAMGLCLLIFGVATLSLAGVQDEARLKQTAARFESQARQALLQAVLQQRPIELPLEPGRFGATEGRLQIKRVGDKAFRSTQRGEVWEFSPTGICEPLQVRLTQAGGSIELSFDPLTACAVKKTIMVNG